jgi:hypothetical protein
MNTDAPQFADYVDCLYSGTEKYVRLDASKTRECRARWRQHGQQVTLISFGCD